MCNFKHHSSYPKEKDEQNYLFPHVCFVCQKSFKKPQSEEKRKCPECSNELVMLSRKFTTPKKTDNEQWSKVKFLIEHGFFFQSVYELREDGNNYKANYPKTISEAKEFVVRFKEQSSKSF